MKPNICKVLAVIWIAVLFSNLASSRVAYAISVPQVGQQPQSTAALMPAEREIDSPLAATTPGSWSALGSNTAGTDGALSHPSYAVVFDIAVSGTDVYVGGCFENAGGDPTADYIAKWDSLTETWSGLGNDGANPPDGAIKSCVALTALAVDGTNVYLGGGLNTWIGGAPAPQAKYLAKWDGANWSGLGDDGAGGSSINNVVEAIAIHGQDVYVGGHFTDVKNGTTTLTAADYIAKWDTLTGNWSALGSNGLGNGALANGRGVEAILILNSEVYVGGTFAVYSGSDTVPNATYLAKWNGTQWSGVGSSGIPSWTPIHDTVYALATDGTNLYAGGSFKDVLNQGTVLTAADYIARWDGTNWSALGSNGSGDGALNEAPIAILIDGTDVYVGGGFTDVNNSGTVLTAADSVARWDALTGNWSALGSNGSGNGSLNTYVYSSLGLAGNKLYVGGEFTNVNNNGTVLDTADYIAAYDIGDGIYRVTPNGVSSSPCGHNWANPCDLQYTLNTLASIGDELWVKAGTYKPTTGIDRFASYVLKNGVAVYGGFAGTETLRTQRNPDTNVTILSGEIGAAGIADNSYHVLVGSGMNNTAVLDGFTITAGNADDLDIDYGGGSGMFISSGSPTLANLVFSGNTALNGGGLFNDSSSPTLMHVTFSGNSAALAGGMYNYRNSNPILVDVTFNGNSTLSGGSGGGMHNQYSSPDLTNVTFSNNTAATVGGGMFNYQSNPTITDVTFSNNSAYAGGGMYNQDSSPTLTNVTFSGNAATHPVDDAGGGMYNYNNSSPTLTNVIIANSTTGGDCAGSTLNASSANNLIEDVASACGLSNGVNNNIVGVDPNLGPLADNGGFTQTMALLSGSPAINAGNNAACPVTDQRRVTRPQGSHCDIGAYEFQDAIPPGVVSIVRAGTNPTSAATADFTVTFSEPVTGVGTGGFGLSTTGITGASLTGITPVSGTTYSVTVNTGYGSGTIRLDLADDDSIKDVANNPLGGVGAGNGDYTNGEVYAVTEGFHISGRYLLDVNGNNFVMRGVNHPHNWYPDETGSLVHIKAWGANTVRVVLSSGKLWPKNSSADVANVISLCKASKLVCVLEVHDTTGYAEEPGAVSLAEAVLYWKEIKSALIGQEAYVIINPGNEPYGNNNPAGWVNDTKNAIAELRNAGLHHTLMVDAPNWGQDWQFIMHNNAASVLASDPDHNLIFSIHMYGVYETASAIQNYVAAFVNAGLPLVIGEFGWDHSDGNPDEDAIMSVAQNNGIGYLGWMWSGGGYLDMVVNFDPNQPTWWGTRLFNGANGICLTSAEASVYGGDRDPIACSIKPAGSSPSGAMSVSFTVTFSEPVTGVTTSDFALATTGVTGAAITGVSGTGATRTVTVNTGSGSGTIRLDLVDDDSIKDMNNNSLGGVGAANGNFARGESYTIDKSVPIRVFVGGAEVTGSPYYVPPGQSTRQTYPLDAGPVKIFSTNTVPIIAALRDAFLAAGGQVESFAQLMGLPREQLSDTYYFPAYNNVTLDGQLRFANVDSIATNVTVTIGGVSQGTYPLQPSESKRISYPLDTGPVVIKSSNGARIIAALRDAYLAPGGKVESFVQLMGLPKEQLSDTYYFPAYNNITLDGQLRFGNVDTIPTEVTVTIGGIPRGTYTLQPNQSTRVSYPLDTGPVVIQSSNGAKIIAALRDAYLVGGKVESFAQLMGLPRQALSDTYYFPAYNNVTLDGQLRFGNVDNVTTDVTVTIGGVDRGTYTLQPSQSHRVNYPLDSGPVVITSSNGATIIAALRDAYLVGGQVVSFVQLMGLPEAALSDTYYFPAYNNLTLSGQLRFGVP